MTLKKIITVPDPFLRKKASSVMSISRETIKLLNDMLETMYKANGIGLAATQIGNDKRLIVMDCGENKNKSSKEKEEAFKPNPIQMINPIIIFKSENLIEREEGCLSIPGYYGKVKRPDFIKVSYIDEKCKEKFMEANGLLAACIQHEIDHLDGILFVDYLSRLKKDMIIRKATKDFFAKAK